MAIFISLSSSYAGNACAIKQSIDNYHNKSETQFFDWLVCSMKSINEILNEKPILFNEKSIHVNDLNTTSIHFLNFDLLISHHDIHEFNFNSINEITEKYKRRYDRFINTLKNKNKIYFIRYCKDQNNIEEDQIHYFYKNIKNINKNLLFKFILISNDDNLQLPINLINKKNFIYINLNEYLDDDTRNETINYYKIIKSYKCIYDKKRIKCIKVS